MVNESNHLSVRLKAQIFWNTNPKACMDALIAIQHPDITPVQDHKEEKKASPI